MKPLRLYEIEPVGLPVIHIAARSNQQAAEMYVTWQAANELPGCAFSVELVPLNGFEEGERLQLQALLARSTEGIARRDPSAEWVIDSEGWTSFDADELASPGLRIFDMTDPTPIGAFVLAADYDRAAELFALHLRAHGGDPDTQLWRQRAVDDLDDADQTAVRQALDLNCEGLVTCDAVGRRAFIMPLGEH